MPNYIVKMRRTVITEVYCEECTANEARMEPWEHATDETDLDQEDWEVLSVQEDKDNSWMP